MDNTEEQQSKQFDWLRAYQFKKGQSGNPGGRPKGKSLKTFAREFLEEMSDEERIEYLSKINPEMVWEMAEGKAPQNVSMSGNLILNIEKEVAEKYVNNKPEDSSTGQPPIQSS